MPCRLILSILLPALLALAGCAGLRHGAPVEERGGAKAPPAAAKPQVPTKAEPAPRGADSRPQVYVVKKGDTLYSIALEHGVDYKELAAINGIDNPGALPVGRELRLSRPATSVVTAPALLPPTVEGRPLGNTTSVKTEPKGVKLPYSPEALEQLQKAPPRQVALAPPSALQTQPDMKPTPPPVQDFEGEGEVNWAWPVAGKVISQFTEQSKGVDISGKLGQPVHASAPGRVLYSGDGIRGYGNLIIIKHNKAYVSVYAHNRELLVKEGQTVAQGQKIAEMGSADANQVKLHFEIRRFGKPVDPLKYLPGDKAS